MSIIVVDGKVYRTDGMSEAEIKAATKAMGAKSVQRDVPPPPSAEQREVDRRVKAKQRLPFNGATGLLDQFVKGASFNFNDEILGGASALTKGVSNAIGKRDFGEIRKEYRAARDTVRQSQDAYERQNKPLSMVAQIAGSLSTPTPEIGALKSLPAFARAGIEGAAYAGLAGAGEAKELADVPRAAGTSAALGSVLGAGAGAVTQVARKGASALHSQSPAAAKDVAYRRVAQALEDSPRYAREGNPLRHTPESAARELKVARARGVPDAAVMDLSPEVANTAAYIRRKPGTGVQNDLYQFSENRMAGRNNSFDDAVREGINPATGQEGGAAHRATLKGKMGKASEDYNTLVTDNAPLPMSDDLADLVYTDNPLMRTAINDAMEQVRGKDLNPVEVGFEVLPNGEVAVSHKPTWRTFDLIRRSLGERAAALKKSGKGSLARDVDAKYQQLRDALGRANPDYTDMLSKQRSVFEEQEGLELGEKVLSTIGRKPKDIFRELSTLKSQKPHAFEDARTGFIDKILNLRNQRGSPVATLRNMMGNPDQRKVLEILFDSGSNLRRFERWLTRQSKASFADAQVAGKQSITSEMGMMADSALSPTQELASSAAHGYGFGGEVGMSGNVIRLLSRFNKTMSMPALAELGRILKGDGSDLVEGIAKAKANEAARKAADRKAVSNVARMTGYFSGTEMGD